MLNKKYPIGVITGLFQQAIEDIHWSKQGNWFSVCAGNSIGFFEIQPKIDFPSDIEKLSINHSKIYSQKYHILNSKGKMPRISKFFRMPPLITLNNKNGENNNNIQKNNKKRKHKRKHKHKHKHTKKYNHGSHHDNNEPKLMLSNHQNKENNNDDEINQKSNPKDVFDKENFSKLTQKKILQKIDQTQSSINHIQDTILSKPASILLNNEQILKSLEGKAFTFTVTMNNGKHLKITCENKTNPKNGKRMSIVSRSLGGITHSTGTEKHVSYVGGNKNFIVISLDYCIFNIEQIAKNKNWVFITSDFYSNIQFVKDHYLVLVFPSGKCNVFDLETKFKIFDQSIPKYYIGTKIKSIDDFIPNVSPLITFYDNLKYFYNKNISNWEIHDKKPSKKN